MSVVFQTLVDQRGKVQLTLIDSSTHPIHRVSTELDPAKLDMLIDDTLVELELRNLVKFWNLNAKRKLQVVNNGSLGVVEIANLDVVTK